MMATTFELAELSDLVYDLKPSEEWKIVEEINNLTGGDIFTENTGFKAAIYEKGNERVVAYAGTEVEIGDYIADLKIILKMLPRQAEEAIYFFEKFYDPEYKTTVTGHSLGGALAEIVGNLYPLKIQKSVTFNSPGVLGTSYFNPVKKRREEIIFNPKAEGVISHYSIQYDAIAWFGTHLGRVFLAKAVEGYWNHRMKQWLEKRYDAEGEYDPNLEINKIVYEAKDYQRPERFNVP